MNFFGGPTCECGGRADFHVRATSNKKVRPGNWDILCLACLAVDQDKSPQQQQQAACRSCHTAFETIWKTLELCDGEYHRVKVHAHTYELKVLPCWYCGWKTSCGNCDDRFRLSQQ
jgi:hypothetical protein